MDETTFDPSPRRIFAGVGIPVLQPRTYNLSHLVGMFQTKGTSLTLSGDGENLGKKRIVIELLLKYGSKKIH